MKRTFIIATMLAIVSVSAIAQNNDFRPSITIGYGRNYVDMGNVFEIYEDTYAGVFSCSSLFVSADFLRFNRYLSGGLYLGGQMTELRSYDDYGHAVYSGYFAGRGGFAANLHLLQCMNVEQNAWDISLNTKLGAFWCPNISPQTEYSLGLSAAYYPFKHVGLSVGNRPCQTITDIIKLLIGTSKQKGSGFLVHGCFGVQSKKATFFRLRPYRIPFSDAYDNESGAMIVSNPHKSRLTADELADLNKFLSKKGVAL